MTRINQTIQGQMETHVFVCYCGESSYLQISRDDEERQYYVEVTLHPTRLFDRVKLAWKALRGLEFSASNSVIIDEVDIASVIDALRPLRNT